MFKSLRESLSRTRNALAGQLATVFGANEITDETWDNLEVTLIQADLGVPTTTAVIEKLRETARASGYIRTDQLQAALRAELTSLLQAPPAPPLQGQPAVMLIVGVNGSGKTTTAAKLGRYLADQGQRVILAAADTFRAAAIDQLQIWGERLRLEVVAGVPNADPGAILFDAVNAAKARGATLVIADTAGRLHTKYNLMEELKKVRNVSAKAVPGAPHSVLLVLDATTGQNALSQARHFKDAVGVTGVVLTKLDSSARGGMAFAICHDLGLPIRYVGTGEGPADLQPFEAEGFVAGLLDSGDGK
jgi:fused signal recognition particle receptor